MNVVLGGNMKPQTLSRMLRAIGMAACLFAGLTAQAQTTYRWVGNDGKVHYSDQPPPAAQAKDVQQKKLKGNVIETSGLSYDTRKAMKENPLTLYTSGNCKENCQMARDLLNRRGAPFKEKVVQTADDAAEFKAATGSGELAVPVLVAGSQSEKGFEENSWNRMLDMAGYPPISSIPNKPSGRPVIPATPAASSGTAAK